MEDEAANRISAIWKKKNQKKAAPASTTSDNYLAPFNPTDSSAVAEVAALASVREGDVIYDLGCGDARVLLEVVSSVSFEVSGVGVEYDPEIAQRARDAVMKRGATERVTILCEDALKIDFSEATVLFLYLVPEGLTKMESRLRNAMVNGNCRAILSNIFSVPKWTPSQVFTYSKANLKLYLYDDIKCFSSGLSMAGYSGPAVPVVGASSAMDPAIREVYEKNGQGQVLRFVDEGKLENDKVGTLAAQMKTIDVEKACAIFKTTMEEAAKGAVPEDLGPPDPSAVMMGTTASQASKDEWESISFGAIAKGEIAACVLAGGQGTRLGLDGPKGNYSIGLLSGKSLFQLFAERLLRLQNLACKKAGVDKVSLPFLVMTSPINHEQTVSAFKENKFWGLTEEDVIFFPQGVLPCFTPEGKFIMEVGHVIATSPDGNGGIYPALESSGSLKFLRDHGVKYLHVFGVDNAVVRPADPRFMGYCIAQGSDCGNKSVWKSHPEEKVGVMAQRGGRYCVAEYSELDAERKNVTDSEGKLKFGAGNICNHFFSVDFLSNVVVPKLQGMYHVANKKIPFAADDGVSTQKPDKNNGIKLEAFIFDVFPMAEGSKMAIYEVEREEFSPVKNPPGDKEDSPDTARAIVNSLHRKWVEAAGGKIEGPADALVEVLPLCSYAGEGLEEIAAGKTFIAPCVIGGDFNMYARLS